MYLKSILIYKAKYNKHLISRKLTYNIIRCNGICKLIFKLEYYKYCKYSN